MGATNDDVLAAARALHLRFSNEMHGLGQHIDREIARLRGDFAELRGRMEEISRRLPATLACATAAGRR